MKKLYVKSSASGRDIPLLITYPSSSPLGIVQIIHGMNEYKERYIDFMNFLSSRGYICAISDHIGHGESAAGENELGRMPDLGDEIMVSDARDVSLYMKKHHPNVPFHLFGHSMGSLAARMYASKYDTFISSLIVCGSPSKEKFLSLGKLLAKTICRFYGKDYKSALLEYLAFNSKRKKFSGEGSLFSWICSDKEVIRKYSSDKNCTFIFSANAFYCLFSLMQNVYSKKTWNVKNRSLPILFIAGKDDPCIISEKKFMKAVNFMRTVGFNNVKSILFENMRHEILNETEKEKVYQTVLDFISENNF